MRFRDFITEEEHTNSIIIFDYVFDNPYKDMTEALNHKRNMRQYLENTELFGKIELNAAGNANSRIVGTLEIKPGAVVDLDKFNKDTAAFCNGQGNFGITAVQLFMPFTFKHMTYHPLKHSWAFTRVLTPKPDTSLVGISEKLSTDIIQLTYADNIKDGIVEFVQIPDLRHVTASQSPLESSKEGWIKIINIALQKNLGVSQTTEDLFNAGFKDLI